MMIHRMLRVASSCAPRRNFAVRSLKACDCNDPSISNNNNKLQPVVAPEPGTVKEYSHHILIKLPAPGSEQSGGAWWPSTIEKQPPVLDIFKEIALWKTSTMKTTNNKHDDDVEEPIKVKISAIDNVYMKNTMAKSQQNSSTIEIESDAFDIMIFPAALHFENISSSHIPHLIQWTLNSTLEEYQADRVTPPILKGHQKDLSRKLLLFVCCHSSRDARCGILGTELATKLKKSIKERKVDDKIDVYQISHVGGHKFAGNVLVYGSIHPCDGDWFGGLNHTVADEFLDALLHMEVGCDGGAEDAVLRKWWRGRMGLSKEEQLELYEIGGRFMDLDDFDELDDGRGA